MNAPTKKTCSSCGASINATAQFCHACGAKQGGESKPLSPAVLGLLALAVVSVVAVISYSVGKSSAPQAAPGGAGAPLASAAGGAPPDISNLTPRQQADALFNRVMTAHETGDFAGVNQFASMAINAYGMLGSHGRSRRGSGSGRLHRLPSAQPPARRNAAQLGCADGRRRLGGARGEACVPRAL
jgi:hypothetical protein